MKDSKQELNAAMMEKISGGDELETITIDDLDKQLHVGIGPMTGFRSWTTEETGPGYYQDNSNNSGAQQNTQNGDNKNNGGLNVKPG